MKKLSSYFFRYWHIYLFAITCMIIAITLDLTYPLIIQQIVDDVIVGGNIEILSKLLSVIFVIGIGRSVFGYLKEMLFDRVSSKIATDMRKHLFAYIQGLSASYFNKTNTGELMARVKEDVDYVWNAIGYVGMLVIEVVIHSSIVLFCMFRISRKLFLIPCVVMPLVAVIAIVMEKKLDKTYGKISEENARLNTIAEENLAGVRTVKAFAREKFEITKFLSHNRKYYELNMEQARTMTRYYPIFQFAGKLLPIITIVAGGIMVINGELTLGYLVAFSEYTTNCVWPMEMLGWLMNDFSAAIASYKKIKKIYMEQTDIVEIDSPIVLDEVKGEICFDKVSFGLENKSILEDISFKIEAGKTLGIMGATGAGKTTIVNLLERFYDVDSGSIRVDGVDIRELSLRQLRGSIAPVMQDVFLFSDTISENIRMGKREQVDIEIMREAAGFAEADGFIEAMDKQYETIIGERGVGLSGGQKQRISIARAAAKKNPILILDDSTSALDMETEYQIQKSLAELRDTTKIIIAHRISAVRYADEIIILEKGKIAERGTHEQLMEQKGRYYQTYAAQYGSHMEVNELCQ